MRVRHRLTARPEAAAQAVRMDARTRRQPTEAGTPHPSDGGPVPLAGRDALSWARMVWNDRDNWLDSRGGIESVFMAAHLLGCREDAVRWLQQRTRL